jgi:nucleosome binding factor SPN SPT16 subunit
VALKALAVGLPASEIYDRVLTQVRTLRRDLLPVWPKTIGHAIGFEFRDKQFVLGPRCQFVLFVLCVCLFFAHSSDRTLLPPNCMLNLAFTLPNLQDAAGQSYTLAIADTVLVTQRVEILTHGFVSGFLVVRFW